MTKDLSQPPTPGGRIGAEEALEGFRALHPAFEVCWREALEMHGAEWAPRLVYGAFARQIEDIVGEDPTTDCAPILDYVETLMREGTEKVEDTVAVFFIETLLSTAATEPDLMAPVLRLLGPLSRAFALALNKDLGTTNKGLET